MDSATFVLVRTNMRSPLRLLISLLVASTCFAPRMMADLGSAKSFVVLSSRGTVVFQNRDNVSKATFPGSVTCPNAAGCTMRIGGKTILMGRGNATAPDQVAGDLIASATASQGLNCSGLKPGTTAICLGNTSSIAGACVTGGGGVSNPTDCATVDTSGTNPEVANLLPKAGPDAAAFSAFLAALTPTQTLQAISVASGGSYTITANAGLNVISVPSIVIGSGAQFSIAGSSGAQVVINIGSSVTPGALIQNFSSSVLLAGGITADNVVFNVLGGNGTQLVQLGNTVTFNGTILAPQQGLVLGDGATSQPTVINGALLFGNNVAIGNNVTLNFFPLAQIVRAGTAAPVAVVDLTQLPPPAPRTGNSSVEADADFTEPVIENAPTETSSQVGSPVSLATTIATATATANTPTTNTPADPLHASPVILGLSNVNGKTPPDTQIAVGQNSILEMVNVSGRIFDKSTGNTLQTFDIGRLFNTSQGQGTDPRVVYDAGSHHFFAAYELRTAGGDTIRLAVADDPTIINGVLQTPWNWTIFTIATNNVDTCFDQPKLGFSDDKVTLSWNDYSNASSCSNHNAPFAGSEYFVVDKASLSTNSAHWQNWGPDSNRFQIVPVQSLTPTTVQYAAYHPLNGIAAPLPGNTIFKVMAFTGDVANGVNFTEQSYVIRNTPLPPAARQPAGGNPSLETGGTRLLTAVWQNDNLWGTMNQGCTPVGDTRTRSCGRLVEISTGTNSLLEDLDLQITPINGVGVDVYYPAVTMDGGGNAFFGFTFSSTALNPSAGVLGIPNGNFFGQTAIVYQEGTAVYSVKDTTGAFTNRWGDYSGAAPDPTDPNVVWMAQEYSAGDWATSIAKVYFGP